ncbi:hypothetical protein D020_0618B, partial [Vibrio parahaemolyticus SBR10290]
QF